ncbi:MAG TPA: four helix bundle protein [Candidatus Kapabacteria bacterium]|nr:four helix bundle protein [Candidatus Kapabacteria bacterium]
MATEWPTFATLAIGSQLVRADSMGANIAEGSGRGSYASNRRFAIVARSSSNEATHWLRRSVGRNLLPPEQTEQLQLIVDALRPCPTHTSSPSGKHVQWSGSDRHTVDAGKREPSNRATRPN